MHILWHERVIIFKQMHNLNSKGMFHVNAQEIEAKMNVIKN